MRLEIPLRLPSAANLREHWATRARRARAQRRAIALAWPKNGCIKPFPLEVVLTRIAPRELDDDNLASAFKTVRDEVAAQLGVDDRDARVKWRCEQLPGPYAIRIAIGTHACDEITCRHCGGVVRP